MIDILLILLLLIMIYLNSYILYQFYTLFKYGDSDD